MWNARDPEHIIPIIRKCQVCIVMEKNIAMYVYTIIAYLEKYLKKMPVENFKQNCGVTCLDLMHVIVLCTSCVLDG